MHGEPEGQQKSSIDFSELNLGDSRLQARNFRDYREEP
jgi:hypothetical protein